MNVATFVQQLSAVELEDVFNPYREDCPVHDKSGAAAIRRRNLRLVLSSSVERGCRSLWFGRDLGHRGGRRTGLALTDEVHVSVLAGRLGVPLQKATRTDVVAERTAAEIWLAISCLDETPMLWNAFPLHPHEPSQPASNRKHTRWEATQTEQLMDSFLQLVRPERVIALGQDAFDCVRRFGIQATAVRHPSYGGQSDFRRGIKAAYEGRN